MRKEYISIEDFFYQLFRPVDISKYFTVISRFMNYMFMNIYINIYIYIYIHFINYYI